jgi:methionine biosynthesis protein MetW
MFDDASFDVVLQIDTLQHLRNAEVMLRETVRVGRVGIVAFPNFAHWPNRLSVLKGRMPVTKRLPYQWYDTPNIRVGTHADLRRDGYRIALRNAAACSVLDSFGLQDGPHRACAAQSQIVRPIASGSRITRLHTGHCRYDPPKNCCTGRIP